LAESDELAMDEAVGTSEEAVTKPSSWVETAFATSKKLRADRRADGTTDLVWRTDAGNGLKWQKLQPGAPGAYLGDRQIVTQAYSAPALARRGSGVLWILYANASNRLVAGTIDTNDAYSPWLGATTPVSTAVLKAGSAPGACWDANDKLHIVWRNAANEIRHWSSDKPGDRRVGSSAGGSPAVACKNGLHVFWRASTGTLAAAVSSNGTDWTRQDPGGAVSEDVTLVESPETKQVFVARSTSGKSSSLLKVDYAGTNPLGNERTDVPLTDFSESYVSDTAIAGGRSLGSGMELTLFRNHLEPKAGYLRTHYANLVDSSAVPLIGQEQSNWCWAASTEMVFEFHGRPTSQCALAKQQAMIRWACDPWDSNPLQYSFCDTVRTTNCCGTPTGFFDAVCNYPWYEAMVLGSLGVPYSVTQTGERFSHARVEAEIKARRPFMFSWRWPGGGGHLMVVKDAFRAEGREYLVVNDPGPMGEGSEWIVDHAAWDTTTPDHSFGRVYYNIRP
jgi:hypothetical protein